MIKIIKLLHGRGTFIDKNEYIKIDEDLQINLILNNINNSKIQVKIFNGLTSKKFNIENNKFIIDKDFIKVGNLKIEVYVFLNNTKIQTYICEDLIIIENDDDFKVIPEIEDLKNEINKHIKIEKELIEKVDKLQKLVSGLYGFKVGDENE